MDGTGLNLKWSKSEVAGDAVTDGTLLPFTRSSDAAVQLHHTNRSCKAYYFDRLADRCYCAMLRDCRICIPIAIAGPIPSAKKTVPRPSVPPNTQPIATTVNSRKVRTNAMG